MLGQAVTPTPSTLWILVVVLLVVLLAVGAFVMRRRSTGLRSTFGAEYDRTVAATGSRTRAESDLASRVQRVKSFDLRELTPGARERYSEEWRIVQARFVDSPNGAITDADRLVVNVMRDRGYPTEDFEQRLADLSVGYGDHLENYRAAHAISLKNDRSEATTEDLRQAMVYYRKLFGNLLGIDPVAETRKPVA